MNLPEGAIDKILYALFGFGTSGLSLFLVCKACLRCHKWWTERKAKKAKQVQDAIEQRVSGEREVSEVLRRVDNAQDAENRLLALQLDRAALELKSNRITIERQVKALVDCWSGHPQTQHHVDVMLELEATRQRQDHLEARLQEEGK